MAESAEVAPAPAPAQTEKGRSRAPFILSLIGGIFILLNGVAVAIIGGILAAVGGVIPGIGTLMAGLGLGVAVIGLLFGILVIVGAALMRSPAKARMGAVIVLILSILSIMIGGGFLIGMILGIVGGALGLKKS